MWVRKRYRITEKTHIVNDSHTRTAHETPPSRLPPYLLDQTRQGRPLCHIAIWGRDGYAAPTRLPPCPDNLEGVGDECSRRHASDRTHRIAPSQPDLRFVLLAYLRDGRIERWRIGGSLETGIWRVAWDERGLQCLIDRPICAIVVIVVVDKWM
jgi:hypothetical protein